MAARFPGATSTFTVLVPAVDRTASRHRLQYLPSPPRTLVFTIIDGDLLWVAGSILLLLGGWLPMSMGGMWAVGIVADIVAIFAILQYVGWRRMRG